MALSADMIITSTGSLQLLQLWSLTCQLRVSWDPSKLSSSKIQKYGLKWVRTGDMIQNELCQKSLLGRYHCHCSCDMNYHDHILNPQFCCVDTVLYLGTRSLAAFWFKRGTETEILIEELCAPSPVTHSHCQGQTHPSLTLHWYSYNQ